MFKETVERHLCHMKTHHHEHLTLATPMNSQQATSHFTSSVMEVFRWATVSVVANHTSCVRHNSLSQT